MAVTANGNAVVVFLNHVSNKDVGLTEESCYECSLWSVVEGFWGTHLLNLTLVHNRYGVGHVHGLLLVVGDVQEGKTNFHLDCLELNLHLSTKL